MACAGSGAVAAEGSSLELGITRSVLLKAAGLAAVAAALPGGKRVLSLVSGVWGGPVHLRLDTYVPHVGTTFRIRRQDGWFLRASR
jgi:hypothetical protein